MNRFWQFNIGHIITIIGGIISLVVVGTKLQARVDTIAERIVRQEKTIEELTRKGILSTINEHERRLQVLEGVANDFRETRTDIKWIKARLNDLPSPERIHTP